MARGRKIRILHVAEAPGGVERYMVTLLEKMRHYEQFEHVLVLSDAFDREKFSGLAKSIEVVDSMHNPINPRDDVISMYRIRKAIRRYRPDILYCHSSKAGAVGRMADMGIRNRVIYNAHGWSFEIMGTGRTRTALYVLVERLLALKTDTIVCISEHEKKSALAHRICREEKLRVILSGIDFGEFEGIDLDR